MEREEAQAMADQTVSYLGGYGRLYTMIGAKHFQYDKEGKLTFKFALCKTANYVSFKLENDLYTVQFLKVSKRSMKVAQEYEGLFFDQLREVFERYTGLYLSMGTMGARKV